MSVFTSTHWNLSAYLCFAGYQLISANPITENRYMFVFDDSDRTAKAAADQFFSSEGVQVDARGVLEAGKHLRRAAKEAKSRMVVPL